MSVVRCISKTRLNHQRQILGPTWDAAHRSVLGAKNPDDVIQGVGMCFASHGRTAHVCTFIQRLKEPRGE